MFDKKINEKLRDCNDYIENYMQFSLVQFDAQKKVVPFIVLNYAVEKKHHRSLELFVFDL